MTGSGLSPETREAMLAPSPATVGLSGIRGRIKSRCEDFVVDEIPAYEPDGRSERHLMVRIRKRELSTPELLNVVARACGVDQREIGCAGRKDREAVTSQWLSLPVDAGPSLARLSHPGLEVLEVHPHGQKLRMGHLKGNRFRIVIRDPGMELEVARHRVRDKLIAIERGGGLANLYGEQRFGAGGQNLERGLELMASSRRLSPQEKFLASAGQSGLFNLYVGLRAGQGWMRQVLPGDLLQRRESGGMFSAEDIATEQARMDRGELVVSGPIYGAKMRAPERGSASAMLELEALSRGGIEPDQLLAHGKRLPGSRRPIQVTVADFRIEDAPAEDGLPAGLELRFSLPAGSYATQLLRELMFEA